MSLSMVAVPVLLETDTSALQLFQQWDRMYYYGHQIMPTFAVATALLYGYTCLKRRNAGKSWTVFAFAAVMTMIMVPFTWVFMAPTNNMLFQLLEGSKTQPLVKSMGEAKELVVKWNWLHVARSLFPLLGAVVGAMGTFYGD